MVGLPVTSFILIESITQRGCVLQHFSNLYAVGFIHLFFPSAFGIQKTFLVGLGLIFHLKQVTPGTLNKQGNSYIKDFTEIWELSNQDNVS